MARRVSHGRHSIDSQLELSFHPERWRDQDALHGQDGIARNEGTVVWPKTEGECRGAGLNVGVVTDDAVDGRRGLLGAAYSEATQSQIGQQVIAVHEGVEIIAGGTKPLGLIMLRRRNCNSNQLK